MGIFTRGGCDMRRFADRNMSRTAAAQMMFCASSCAACAAMMMMNIALNLDASLLASILFVLFILSILVLLAILSLLVRIILVQKTGSVFTAETKRLAP